MRSPYMGVAIWLSCAQARTPQKIRQDGIQKGLASLQSKLSASARDGHPLSVAVPPLGGDATILPGRTMRRRKSFNIPLVKTAAGLALFSLAKGSQTSKTVLADPLAALEKTGANLIANKRSRS